ncbi:MAG: RNA polymerase subunit sigma [Clostridium sp.]
MFDIKTEIKLYRIREIAIEDLKLRIEEISKGNNFNEIGYDEKFQSSKSCPNNDKDMNDIERLTKKIKSMKIANKRVDNALKIINGIELEVVTRLLIKSESTTKVAKKVGRTPRHVERILDRAIKSIEKIVA